MPAGTITLKNNSAAVAGTGTAFTSELKANDFIVVTVGQTVYTLGVKSVESNTALTLVRNFDGPSAGGLAWTPIPYATMVSITAQTHAYTAEALRGLLLDKRNWQQVFSGTGDITVKLPDGSEFTGPAWNSIVAALNLKAAKTDLKDYAQLSGPTFTGPVITRGAGTTGSSHYSREFKSILKGYKNSSGEEMYVSLFMNQIDAVDTFATLRVNAYSTVRDFTYNSGGSGIAPGSWINNSDKRLKTNVKVISEPLLKMKQLRGYRWDRVDGISPGMGFVAQEVQDVFPDQVFAGPNRKLDDGTVIERVLSVDAIGVSAALHHEAILALMDRVDRHDGLLKKIMGGVNNGEKPIIKLFRDGTSELNGESQTVTTERVSEGVYRVSCTFGFNADAQWGGSDGGIEVPHDRNKQPLIWVDYEVEPTGDLLIKTYHRTHPTAPAFARNEVLGYDEGMPIDIPKGRWIDLRVEMPIAEEPEPDIERVETKPANDIDAD